MPFGLVLASFWTVTTTYAGFVVRMLTLTTMSLLPSQILCCIRLRVRPVCVLVTSAYQILGM